MKRFLVVLLALGMIMAFSAPAAATDVKFSGSYYIIGWYDNNHDLVDGSSVNGTNGASSAFYAQRLRVNTVFQVAEGLKLVTRFDAMERVVGGGNGMGVNWASDTAVSRTQNAASDGTNISWERAYVQFAIPTGSISAGYMSAGTWGTVFEDSGRSSFRVKYVGGFSSWTFLALLEKDDTNGENDIGTSSADSDYDKYALAAIYKWQGGNAGLLYYYLPNKSGSDAYVGANPTTSRDVKLNLLAPYFKLKAGNIYLEGEASVFWGDLDYDAADVIGGQRDVDYKGYAAYLYGNIDLGQLYVGGQFAWVSGDDPNTPADNEGGYAGGEDYDPCLILFNDNLDKWMGSLGSFGDGTYRATTDDQMRNAYLYQIFAGVKPMDKLDIKASYSVATADEKPSGYVDEDYGSEFDVTATYKLYDNLTYMVGFGYLWTGDYFKGKSANNKVDDNYVVVNKLTLKF